MSQRPRENREEVEDFRSPGQGAGLVLFVEGGELSFQRGGRDGQHVNCGPQRPCERLPRTSEAPIHVRRIPRLLVLVREAEAAEPIRGPIERFPVHPCVRKDRGDGGLPVRKKVQEKIQCAHRLLEEFEGQPGANSLTLANTCARPVFGNARVSGFQTRAAS